MATVLVVTVLRAEQLKGKDWFSKSDPYVKLKLADTTKKTVVIMNNRNPEWNQTFEFAVKDPETDSLAISVYDWDQDTRHDLMGVQVVSLKQLKPNILEPFTLNLLKNDKKDRRKEKNLGKISLSLRLEYRQTPLTDSADAEPYAEDEEVNEEDNVAEETPLPDSAEGTLVAGEGVEAPVSDGTLDEGSKHEEGTTNEEAQSPETHEAIVVEDFKDGKPAAGDEEVHEEENVAEEAPLPNSAEAIPLVQGENVGALTSDEDPVKREPTNEEAQSPETGEAVVHETVADEISVRPSTHTAIWSTSWTR